MCANGISHSFELQENVWIEKTSTSGKTLLMSSVKQLQCFQTQLLAMVNDSSKITTLLASFVFYPLTKEISVLSIVFFYREASKAISSRGKGEEKSFVDGFPAKKTNEAEIVVLN
jgi:hypothetical protein